MTAFKVLIGTCSVVFLLPQAMAAPIELAVPPPTERPVVTIGNKWQSLEQKYRKKIEQKASKKTDKPKSQTKHKDKGDDSKSTTHTESAPSKSSNAPTSDINQGQSSTSTDKGTSDNILWGDYHHANPPNK